MKKITIIFMSVLMIFASCSMDTSYDDTNETEEKTNTEIIEEPKENDSENNTEEPSNEENDSENDDIITEPTENDNDEEGNSENTEIVEDEPSNEEPKENDSENNDVVENKDWCDISEDTLILGLNYFVCIDNSQTKLKPSINVESKAKTGTFLVRGYASKYVEIRVRYDNEKLNFSSVNDTYTVIDVTREGSDINITIEWK